MEKTSENSNESDSTKIMINEDNDGPIFSEKRRSDATVSTSNSSVIYNRSTISLAPSSINNSKSEGSFTVSKELDDDDECENMVIGEGAIEKFPGMVSVEDFDPQKHIECDYCGICFERGMFFHLHSARHPSVIIPDFLFLSNCQVSENFEELKELQIEAIVNVAFECDNVFPDHFEYHKFELLDEDDADILSLIPSVVKLLEVLERAEKRTLIHCVAGASRSASFVIAYIMIRNQISYYDAFNYTKNHRSVIRPNPGFVKQLGEYECSVYQLLTPSYPKVTLSRSKSVGFAGRPPLPQKPSRFVKSTTTMNKAGIDEGERKNKEKPLKPPKPTKHSRHAFKLKKHFNKQQHGQDHGYDHGHHHHHHPQDFEINGRHPDAVDKKPKHRIHSLPFTKLPSFSSSSSLKKSLKDTKKEPPSTSSTCIETASQEKNISTANGMAKNKSETQLCNKLYTNNSHSLRSTSEGRAFNLNSLTSPISKTSSPDQLENLALVKIPPPLIGSPKSNRISLPPIMKGHESSSQSDLLKEIEPQFMT